MKIGILRTGHVVPELAEEHGEYPDMFRQLLAGRGFTFQTWSVIDNAFPPSPDDADGWLVTGSRFSVNDDLPWIRKLEDFLRRCYSASSPVVGICFGHQALAKALGGQVELAAEGWGVGQSCFDTKDGPIKLNCFHQDQVTVPPPDAEVIGSSPFCRYAMLAYGDKGLSVQPHPEFSEKFLLDLIEARGVGLIPAEILERARAELDNSAEGERVAEAITAFFHAAARRGGSLTDEASLN